MERIGKQAKKDLGDKFVTHPSDSLLEKMVHQLGRIGKKAGKGFYDYPTDPKQKKLLWPELAQHYPVAKEQPSADDIKQRLLYAQAVETLHRVAEGVITSGHDVDICSIF